MSRAQRSRRRANRGRSKPDQMSHSKHRTSGHTTQNPKERLRRRMEAESAESVPAMELQDESDINRLFGITVDRSAGEA